MSLLNISRKCQFIPKLYLYLLLYHSINLPAFGYYKLKTILYSSYTLLIKYVIYKLIYM